MGGKIGKREIIIVLGISILFLIFAFSLFLKGHHSWDMGVQQNWGNTALEKGISTLYVENSGIDYPPGYVYILRSNAWISLKLFNTFEPLLDNYIIISKLVPTLALLLSGLLLYFIIRKERDNKTAILGLFLYLFNLGLIFNAAYWGQVDAYLGFLVILSVFFLIKEKYLLSVLSITLAVLTKVQSIVLVPIIGLIILLKTKVKIWIKSALVALTTFVIVFLPMITSGTFLTVFFKSFRQIDLYPKVTVNAFNSWFLISPTVPNWMDALWDGTNLFGISLKFIGLSLLAFYLLFVLYSLWKKPTKERMVLAAASMAFAFFMLPTQIHERHLFPFFVLLLMYYLLTKRFFWTYIIISLNYLINLIVLFGPSKGSIVFYQIGWIIEKITSITTLNQLGIIVSAINLVLFINFSYSGIFEGLKKELKEDWRKFTIWLIK